MKKLVITGLILCNSTFCAFANGNYGIVKVNNVNIYEKPGLSPAMIKMLRKGELVFFIEKTKIKSAIEDTKYFWYRVKTSEGVKGWVYGKYLYWLAKSKIPDKYYTKIIDLDIANKKLFNSETLIHGINFLFDKERNIIIFQVKFTCPEFGLFKKYYYELNNNYNIALNTHYDEKVIFFDEHVYGISSHTVRIYNQNIRVREDFVLKNSRTSSAYKLIAKFNVFQEYKKHFYNSYLKFDVHAKIVTVYFKLNKNDKLKTEKFQYNGLKFRRIK